ncbi:MAG: phosphoenolpyruvate carboxylase, partial [Tsuneonella troitsensis]
MKTVADLVERLRVHHRQTADTPLFNPVFQLSLDLSRDLESGALTIDGLGAMVAELECSGLKSRADRLEALVEPDKADATIAALVAEEGDFDTFAERWSRPQLHAVFTAHPTFLLAPAQSNAIAAAASDRDGSDDAVCAVSGERPALTLDFEHGEAMRAIAHAQDARDRIVERIFEQAQARWPDRWRELAPVPFRFATWVGYDMDGRTDIKWHTSIAYRLAEKARRLGRYADCLEGIAPGHQLVDQLRRAAAHAGRHATEFEADLSDPAALAAAANGLTSDHPDKLLTLAPVIAQIEAEAEAGPQAVAFRTLAAAMRADGLGMGWIHFRVNASQLHNAIRRRLPEGHAIEIASRGALATLRAMLAEVRPLRANFAALAVESSTAIRQFISMAQILHHVDADAPIRMLIAECEQP